MDQVNSTLRLAALRKLMKSNNISTYIIPSGDSHASEYVADCFRRREYISGFDGSSGWAAVSEEGAALTTDGRYLEQAAQQLDCNWQLLNSGWEDWVAEQCKGGKSAGVDPTLITPAVAKELAQTIQKVGGYGLVPIRENLIDTIWQDDRPAVPVAKIFVHPERYAGKSIKAKITELRETIMKLDASGIYVSMLDEVAWLFNLRGNDIKYSPLFYCYAFITADKAILYVNESKIDRVVSEHLTESGVNIKPYDSFFENVEQAGEGKYLITSTASWALDAALGSRKAMKVKSPIADAKSVKNEVELEGMRACHIRDGAALASYFAWLEDQLVAKHSVINEAQAADKLLELREKQGLFVGNSFATISSTGPNPAIVHYHATHRKSSVIDPNRVYLCDSGAQYHNGTTDTTRTFHFGTPSDYEKEVYTLVLKGLIALHQAVFPSGITGFSLNAFARQFLWNAGLNFHHSTSHGVGSFLAVHEGPIGIGSRRAFSEHPLRPGNVLSNEPGFYQKDDFGIRIENMMIVVKVKTKNNFGGTPFYGFENVTMVPYCRNLIDLSLLDLDEKSWINARNAETLEKIQDLVSNDELTLAWLRRNTEPL